jgi:hypothetical protein
MTKPKTQAQLDRAADQRLKKTYGVGLDWYESELKMQGGVCKLCGNPPGTRRLHVDHDHKWTKVKIGTEKTPAGNWIAEATYQGKTYIRFSAKRNDAIRDVKGFLKRASIRSLLCFRCNSFLVGFNDPAMLRKAADYIEKHQGVKP